MKLHFGYLKKKGFFAFGFFFQWIYFTSQFLLFLLDIFGEVVCVMDVLGCYLSWELTRLLFVFDSGPTFLIF